MLTRFIIIFLVIFGITACGGGSDSPDPSPTATPVSETPTPTPTQTPTPTPTGESVEISGTVTYDLVPNASNGGLDYGNMSVEPIRGATVQALNSVGAVVAETQSSASGTYVLGVNENSDVRIRVAAELRKTGSLPNWHFAVTDNTSNNALYVMDGDLINSGTENSQRDLHADSGWNGIRYSSTRVAGPFAILDAVYQAKELIVSVDPDVDFSPTELRWSVNNVAAGGDLSSGLIGTSFFDPGSDVMYILGDANNDTDEYDRSVIQHEWAHYFEDTLSRSDSIGGPHQIGASIDMRVAFGEGFANAFSGIAGEIDVYFDSSGVGQAFGIRLPLDVNTIGNAGWFSEDSVAEIVFDIADGGAGDDDNIALGFGPIYNAMSSQAYVGSEALTTIYLFAETLKELTSDANDAQIDQLLLGQSIFGTGVFGEGETNDSAGNITFALPVYNEVNVGDTINLCGNNREGEYNGLDVRRFVRVNLGETRRYNLSATETLGDGNRDPVIDIHRGNVFVGRLNNDGEIGSETGVADLQAGLHIFEVFDDLNVDQNGSTGGSSCFEFRVF